ncbi:MAG: hypothetical protein ACYTG7_03530 [Planctomycetota bacterium]
MILLHLNETFYPVSNSAAPAREGLINYLLLDATVRWNYPFNPTGRFNSGFPFDPPQQTYFFVRETARLIHNQAIRSFYEIYPYIDIG